MPKTVTVALRKESVDRNTKRTGNIVKFSSVALRKESVDRNLATLGKLRRKCVALRKESVDRNKQITETMKQMTGSLSARRAWIEIKTLFNTSIIIAWSLSARRAWIEIEVSKADMAVSYVALRKESVDRNIYIAHHLLHEGQSLSARRAWIEILMPLE